MSEEARVRERERAREKAKPSTKSTETWESLQKHPWSANTRETRPGEGEHAAAMERERKR